MIFRDTMPEDVRWCYKLMLGRMPDDPRALLSRAIAHPTRRDLVSSFVHSTEFNLHFRHMLYPGLDCAILDSYAGQHLCSKAGFVTDFLGGQTRTATVLWSAALDGAIEPLPVCGNFFGSFPEWVALLSSVDEAIKRGERSFSVVELGAAWGPWMIAAGLAARKKGINNINLIGVEADVGLCNAMAQHAHDNGFEGSSLTIRNVAVLPQVSLAAFPILVNPSFDFGGTARALSAGELVPSGHREVVCASLSEILTDAGRINLLVHTINSFEIETLSSVDWSTVEVGTIIVSTTSEYVDLAIKRILGAAGWICRVSVPCDTIQDLIDGTIWHLQRDGCQYWINPNFD